MSSITRRTFGLAAPYWLRSNHRSIAWVMGAVLLVTVFAVTGLSFWLTELQKAFFDALEKRDTLAFGRAITTFFGGVAALVATIVFRAWLEQALEIRWRAHLTRTLMSRWLEGTTFYRIERDGLCDNPDQRLSEDTTEYVRLMIKLTLGFIGNLGTLLTMGWLLWKAAEPVTFDIAGGVTIPGYLFWVAIFWGSLQTVLTHFAGHRLAAATVVQQSAEADFRFALAKVRDASEQIALYRGNANEASRLDGLFLAIRRNWAVLMKHNVFLNIASTTFSVVGFGVPIFAMAPHVLAGEMTLGVLMQDIAAFGATAGAIAWLALSYRDLFQLSARVQRLAAMDAAIDREPPKGIEVHRTPEASTLRAQDVHLGIPDGRLLTIVDDVAFAPGERWLVRGPSGCGKSTLLRAIAGLWPFSKGRIHLPGTARMMFVPQKSYLPESPLAEVLAYPSPADAHSREAYEQALTDCRLPHLVARLDDTARWSHQLSPGEQQRLAFAQVLLNRPDVVFMDEATSALDNDTEAHLMTLVMQRLPACTVVSVAHRTTLDVFHDRQLNLRVGAAAATS